MPASAKDSNMIEERFAAEARVGRVVGKTIEGYPIVDFDGSPAGPKPARAALPFDQAAALSIQTSVLLVFENGDPGLPIIIGRLPSGGLDLSVVEGPGRSENKGMPAPQQRIVLEAQQEIVLQCGHSSLTLQSDGKIVLRGRDLVSRASRRNRIQGGSVNIN